MAPDLLSKIRREIDERLSELRPLLSEYERLLVATEALQMAGSMVDLATTAEPVAPTKQLNGDNAQPVATSSPTAAKPQPERAARGAAREAILAALEHGSHTVTELAVVTAMSGPSINGHLRRLVAEGAVLKIEREGKAAWALPQAVS